MAIYKPTNCHPFADAIDITRAFLTVEKKENGTWGVKQPDPVYLTCKLETGNTSAIGYKVRLYVGGNLAFEGSKVSPINELPAFADDATVNSGVNGTYLAIPFIQHSDSAYYVSRSWNSLYLTGSDTDIDSSVTPCLKCDYFIGDKIDGDNLSSSDYYDNWQTDGSDYFYFVGSWDGKLNGGHVVEEGDVVCLSFTDGEPCIYMCHAVKTAEHGLCLEATSLSVDVNYATTCSGLLYIRKGDYCGLYQYYRAEMSDPAELTSIIDWGNSKVFAPGAGLDQNAISGFGDSQLSWEIELYQGPEDYSSLVTTSDGAPYITNGAGGIPDRYFDMQITNGQILGSCATRLHLGTMIDNDVNNMLLPGEDLHDPLVLQDSFCELFNNIGTKATPVNRKMVPSFPISQFDSSLGIVYPKDGYLTQEALESFRASSRVNTGYDNGKFVGARFYKYSSNASDLVSSEKARAYYNDLSNATLDPRTFLVNGATVDGVVLVPNDRVVWNSSFDSGKQNGLWVVPESGAPGRPADGDSYADYIGKVILITEGNNAGTVVQSDAVAGFSSELGQVPLWFQKQKPIRLHNQKYGALKNTPSEITVTTTGGSNSTYRRNPSGDVNGRYSWKNVNGTASYAFTADEYIDDVCVSGVMPEPGISNVYSSPTSGVVLGTLASLRYCEEYDYVFDPSMHLDEFFSMNVTKPGGSYIQTFTTTPLPVESGTEYVCGTFEYFSKYGVDSTSEKDALRGSEKHSVMVRIKLNSNRTFTVTSSEPSNNRYIKIYLLFWYPQETQGSPSYLWFPAYVNECEEIVAPGNPTGIISSYCLSEKGLNMGMSFACVDQTPTPGIPPILTRVTTLEPIMDDFQTEVLFNSSRITYISPSSSVTKDMLLRLKYGATAQEQLIGGSVASADIPILSFNGKFNRITHMFLTTPLPSAKNDGVVPVTPYRYDIMSCFRVSDLNGFVSVVPLTPYLAPADYDGKAVAGYTLALDGMCFQPGVENWEAARVVYALESSEDDLVQDTGWFTDKGLDVHLLGLEPGSEYNASLYLKDSYGRVTRADRAVSVPSEDDASKTGFYDTPTLTMTPIQSSTGDFSARFRIPSSQFGTTDVTDLSSTCSTSGAWTTDSISVLTDYVAEGDYFEFIVGGAWHSYTAGSVRYVSISVSVPNGDHVYTAGFTGNYQSSHLSSVSISPSPSPVFTGNFPGTLNANLDCSTQSVVLEYVPLESEYTKEQKEAAWSDWPACLPPYQNGTIDIYRREYAEFEREGCCRLKRDCDTGFWYGSWQPVAINCETPVIRDFNVKQGHSYQYAIFPKNGPTLKVARQARQPATSFGVINTSMPPNGTTYRSLYVAFDNSVIGLPTDGGSGGALVGITFDGSQRAVGPSPTVHYNGPLGNGEQNGYIYVNMITAGSGPMFPARANISLTYKGVIYRAKVIFTDETTYTVEPIDNDVSSSIKLMANDGKPVYVQWDAWSLVELEEVDPESLFGKELARHPFVKKAYKADLDKIWLFRYDMDNGTQTINMTKSEITTLGKYPRFSSGMLNAESGDVSAWLGSEVVPGTRLGYVERRRSTIWVPAATNEAAAMLAAFREMVASDNPKLLRDRKGRSWIVQTASGSSSVMDTYVGKPAKVSFSWKQIGATGPFVAIWGDGDALPELDKTRAWAPKIILRND